ncbi:MAG: hypothetical protein QOE37_877, partial [Microbacteriaceae bacterium]|nr:hypothetical protein [Microbacteriaceae bacterium]
MATRLPLSRRIEAETPKKGQLPGAGAAGGRGRREGGAGAARRREGG